MPARKPFLIGLCSVSLSILGPAGSAQTGLQFDASVPVEDGSLNLDLAWAGGMNAPQIGELDLDLDGLRDLVVFDRIGDRVMTLLNTGGTGTNRYRLSRAYDHIWPFRALHDWALFRDYDCDGQVDIFSYSVAGFSVYRNTSANGILSFELLTFRAECDYVFTDGTSQRSNLFVSADDLPGIADVDGDGDLDVLTFSQLGTFMEYYKNLSIETYGTCDSLAFVRRNACWGRFAENTSTNAVTLNVDCPFNVPAPEIGPEPGNPTTDLGVDRAEAHAGSAVTPLDLDGNGVMDLLLGDIAYANLVALTNGGTVDNSLMTAVDNLFPSTDVTVDLPIFPAGFHLDVDGDDVRDLLVCASARGLAQNYESVWYYHNAGTDAQPDFEFQQRDLFQSRMLDLGEGANPVPFDHNGDGLMDLIISNEGYYHSTGNYVGKLALLENIGTIDAPAFRLVTDDYMGLSTSGIGTSMYPAFADMDGDGDKDMYIGDLQGRLHFYRNVASGPVAQFTLAQPNVAYADGTEIDVGRQAAPQFIDLDRDGLSDLVIGEQNGNLNYLRNTGTTNAPGWTLITDSLGHVHTSTAYTLGHSVPFVYADPQGAYEILVGSEAGTLWHYTGIDGNLGGTWTLADSSFMGIDEGFRATVCLNDFTGDGELDLVVGNFAGGLGFWRSDTGAGIQVQQSHSTPVGIRPNPSTGLVEVVIPGSTRYAGATMTVHSAIGQEVLHGPVRPGVNTLDLGVYAPGVYTIRISDGSGPVRVMIQ
ncbi:MAG: T9SS type A sorting domain-containing protein [Flavobacteriales bacterium]|jgi:hypothetical protein|nr:T9SS type A sorting domain-containing protein [Flavobacteriales bacterium]